MVLWLNAEAAAQMSFIGCLLVFFMTLLLNNLGILSASKPHCGLILPKPILKFLTIYRNTLGKQHYIPSNIML